MFLEQTARTSSGNSVVKTIAQLREDFARIQVVDTAEGKAVVQEDASIGDVDGLVTSKEAR